MHSLSSNSKKLLLILCGIVFTIVTIALFILFLSPEYDTGFGEFFAVIFSFIFNLIFWLAILYIIKGVDTKSTIRFINNIGVALIGLIPLALIIGGFCMSTKILYGYGILIILIGIFSVLYGVKKKDTKYISGATGIVIVGFIYIFVLLFLRIRW